VRPTKGAHGEKRSWCESRGQTAFVESNNKRQTTKLPPRLPGACSVVGDISNRGQSGQSGAALLSSQPNASNVANGFVSRTKSAGDKCCPGVAGDYGEFRPAAAYFPHDPQQKRLRGMARNWNWHDTCTALTATAGGGQLRCSPQPSAGRRPSLFCPFTISFTFELSSRVKLSEMRRRCIANFTRHGNLHVSHHQGE
jgi:hypothetical protein